MGAPGPRAGLVGGALHVMPLVALLASLSLGLVVGGPGAVSFCVPALLWIALRGHVFETSALVLGSCAWNLLALSTGNLDIDVDYDSLTASSQVNLQIGLALMTMGPLVVATSSATRAEVLERLELLATHDGLTGVLSRQAFEEEAAAQLDRLAADARAATVLMVDLDHFKQVNDGHGHRTGDRLLTAAATALSEQFSSLGPVGRVGGEEFAALVSGLDEAEARQRADALLETVARLRIAGPSGPVGTTASIGLAHDPQAASSLEDLMERADRALYQAKDTGRARVEVAPDPT